MPSWPPPGARSPSASATSSPDVTKIWAHRGASVDAPENTLAAFRAAVEQDADGVELDVQLTADGHVVVCHDETLDRTTDGTGPLKDRTLAELQALDAGAGERVPTLAQVLELLAPTRLEINVELKNSVEPYPGLQAATLAVVRHAGMADRVWYSSFAHETLPPLRALEPTARLGLLVSRARSGKVAAAATAMGAAAVHPRGDRLLIPGWAAAVRRAGLALHVWTVDSPLLARRAAALGVDAVITNRPGELRAALGR